MLERIVAAIVSALAWFVAGRVERGSTAVDADRDPGRLLRSRRRIRDWLRKQDRARQGGRSDEGRT